MGNGDGDGIIVTIGMIDASCACTTPTTFIQYGITVQSTEKPAR